ncbi:PREDICTED: protein Smaug isoform X1 [Rhagoletis zephyria]|uniref:protein Smaug isoform X1 n=2 Tax=Rhagoletis zephyria TaxID=28612 RepID=UPI0008112565|nr:PREDICTED: protein Smaug isoform X1 [Rhagoletis zephyria]XP_017469463.1 PREDICTED: protein Smaug isoform X1 [Rhagoletis zephyria]
MKYTTGENSGNSHNMCGTNDQTPKTFDFARNQSPITFSEQVTTVTRFFEGWNDCERTVVIYALLKRLRYPSLKFLQYAIDHALTQSLGSDSNLSSVIIDINANNPSYLQNLLNAYRTLHLNDAVDALTSGSLDKESMPCYGSDFQITNCDERKLYEKKKEILCEVLNMLPLLKPGNDDAKLAYLALVPAAVRDTMNQRVPTELVQQIFSYLLIHPAISNEDRRSLSVWLRHLEDHLHATDKLTDPKNPNNYTINQSIAAGSDASVSSITSSSSMSNNSMSSSGSSAAGHISTSHTMPRSIDWQTIAPPSKQHHLVQQTPLPQPKSHPDWSSFPRRDSGFSNSCLNNLSGISSSSSGSSCSNRRNSSITDQLCDNFNGINLNELGSSQNKMGLSLGIATIGCDTNPEESSLVNGVAAAAAATAGTAIPGLFGNSNNTPMINIVASGANDTSLCASSSANNPNNDDHDTSFSKNGTEIVDFEPHVTINVSEECKNGASVPAGHEQNANNQLQQKSQMEFTSMTASNYEQMDVTRWSLDGKLGALKTRRSNSLTTQAISTSSSSSNSSVITVNDNCSNSTENLAQFANKPRSFSLSIEHQRGVLANSGSDTRLDDFKPGYIKFQTRNVGMSNIGLWLKSLRLHKYIDLFKNMTYEDMLCITEEYLQGLGVTKGASHKLALCIEKLKDRSPHLSKLEQDLRNGQTKIQAAVEDLANMVLSPMKPVEAFTSGASEDNVALGFLKVVDIVSSMIQHDTGASQDEENINVLMWVLDRSIHNEAFVNQSTQLKELKFKLSKLKMSIGHKAHHVKNGSVGNLNKPRWGGKSRKCDVKNGSNDRINHRKNSNDTLNFSINGVPSAQQQQHHGIHTQPADFEKVAHLNVGANNSGNNGVSQQQYKSSSYPNFMSNQHQQGKQQHQNHHSQLSQQQQQMQPAVLSHHAHFPALPSHQQQQQPQHHRRSLNNLIVVSGGPQQAQKMTFKPGQGIVPVVPTSTESQLRRTSLTTTITNQSSNNVNLPSAFAPSVGNVAAGNGDTSKQKQNILQAQHQQQTKQTMTSAVMVSTDELALGGVIGPQQQPQQHSHLINNNSSMLNNNLLCQQQQQQLQLLAAAAAAVGNSCRNSNLLNCLCNVNANGSNNCSKTNCCSVNNANSCSNLPTQFIEPHSGNQRSSLATPATMPLLNNINMSLKDKFPTKGSLSNSAAVNMNDINSLDQLETLCLQMTEQAIN